MMENRYQSMVVTLPLNGKGERTQQAYTRAVRMLGELHGKSPDLSSEDQLRDCFLHRNNVTGCSPKTMRICYRGIRFFHEKVLARDWHILDVLRAQ